MLQGVTRNSGCREQLVTPGADRRGGTALSYGPSEEKHTTVEDSLEAVG